MANNIADAAAAFTPQILEPGDDYGADTIAGGDYGVKVGDVVIYGSPTELREFAHHIVARMDALAPTGDAPVGDVTERHVLVLGVSEGQFRALAPLLGLPPTWFGRWKGGPGELCKVSFDAGGWSCGSSESLDMVIRYAREQGLAYEETITTRYQPTSADDLHLVAAALLVS